MDTLHTPAASKDQIEAAFSTALDDIRAALHKLAETLEQDHYSYDLKRPMDAAHDLLNDFEPVYRAEADISAENARLAREEERELYRNTPVVL